MTATVHELRRLRRATPVKLPATFERAAAVFGLPRPATFTHFRLRRFKGGTEVFLIDAQTRLVINLSLLHDVSLPSFRAARKWIAAFADRHRLSLVETRTWR